MGSTGKAGTTVSEDDKPKKRKKRKKRKGSRGFMELSLGEYLDYLDAGQNLDDMDIIFGTANLAVDIDLDSWIFLGYARGWISDPYCGTHEGPPLTDAEHASFEEGFDPCVIAMRLHVDPDYVSILSTTRRMELEEQYRRARD